MNININSTTNQGNYYKTIMNNNKNSNGMLNMLNKQKKALEEKMTMLQESDLSMELKQENMKELQEEMRTLEQEILEAQLNQLAKKQKVEKREEERQDKIKEEEQPNVLNETVMQGIISATNDVKRGDTAYAVYKKAKASKNTTVMNKAMNHATQAYGSGLKHAKSIEEGIEVYKKQKQNQIKEEEKERLEELKNNEQVNISM